MITLVALLSLALPQDAADAADAAQPPNIVVLLVDDMGWRDLGCTGSPFYETPRIDALAARGVRFQDAYAAAPVCSPSRAALMTGKHPARLHNTDYFGGRRKGKLLPAEYDPQLALEEVTLAEALKEHGYRTGFFGKWHLGDVGFHPEDQGFDVNVGGWRAGHPYKGYFVPWENPKLEDGPEGEYLTDRLTDEALRFIEESKDGPFLCYFAYYAVHTPLQAREDLKAPYARKRQELAYTDEQRWGKEGGRKLRLVQDHAVYAGMVAAVDESVGRITAQLEALELADNTIIVFTSDNGGLSTSEGHPTSNLPLRAGKGWNYEGGLRVPMIWSGPGVSGAGRVTEWPAIGQDVYPTLLELAGLPSRPKQHLDGESLAEVLRGAAATEPRGPLFWHYPHYGNQGGRPSGVVRQGDLKLIEFYEDGRLELYRMGPDAGEAVDLASEQKDVAEELRKTLAEWRTEVGANMPRPNPDWKEPRE